MRLDFDAILRDEATNVPKEMEPFLRQAGRWQHENQTWGRYNHAYDRAFTIIAEQCLTGGGREAITLLSRSFILHVTAWSLL